MRIDRRTLLVGTGAGAGLILAYALWPREAPPLLRAGRGEALLGPGIAISPAGRVTVAIPQVETGQGIWTGLAQLAADELGAAWETVAAAPALGGPFVLNRLAEEEGWREWSIEGDEAQITAGSTSMRAFAEPMRELGAAARALLMAEAAERWDVAAAECDTSAGFVTHEGKKLGFGELAEAAARRPLPSRPLLRATPGGLVGQPLPRLDAVPKSNGSLRFAGDVRLPGMLFASLRTGGRGVRVATAPPRGVQFLNGDGWLAAVAADWWSAEQALAGAAIRTFGMAGGDDAALAEALEAALGSEEGEALHLAGDVEQAFAGVRPLSATYRAGAALHHDLEPPTATARLSGGSLEIWAPTQAPELSRRAAARAGGTGLSDTILYPMLVGGQGGRALAGELVPVAAELARRTGKPVQVTMSRTEQVRSDALRSPLLARMLARPMPDGSIAGWRMRLAGGDGTNAALARLLGGDKGAAFRKAALHPLPYAIPNISLEAVGADLPLRLGYHRGELSGPLTFFAESFLDELARIGGRDPLSMRMALLGSNPRLARCLTRATALGGWDGGGAGSQMGLAAASLFGSHIAVVAQAGVSQGAVSVSRMVAVVDCGEAINSALVRTQVEGGLIAGLAFAIAPAPSFRHGRVLGPIEALAPSLNGVPEILVEILASRAAPGGVNGLGSAVAPAAVGNALAAATGRRLRSLPLDPMS